MRKNRQKRRSLQDIRTLITELEATGLSAAQLARRENVSLGTVYQWKRKVREDVTGNYKTDPPPIELILTDSTTGSSPLALSSSSGLILAFDNGIKCTIEPDFDAETLLRVIGTLSKIK